MTSRVGIELRQDEYEYALFPRETSTVRVLALPPEV